MLAGCDTGAAFNHLAFEIGSIYLELLNHFSIDEESRMGWFGLIRTMAIQHEAETVLRIHRESVNEMCGMTGTQSGFVVMKKVFGERRMSAGIVDPDWAG